MAVTLCLGFGSPALAQTASQPVAKPTASQTSTNAVTTSKNRLIKVRYTATPARVLINSSASSERVTLQRRKYDQVLVARGTDVRRWGEAVKSDRTQRVKDDRWYSLEQFPDLKHSFDPASRTLYIGSAYANSLKPQSGEPTQQDRITTAGLTPTTGGNNTNSDDSFFGGDFSPGKASRPTVPADSAQKPARDSCEFLTDSVLNANKVNYQSLLLNVHINGVDLKSSHQFIRRPCGPLLAPILDMRDWRIKVKGKNNVLIDDVNWLNLEDFPGIGYEVNTATQEIFLTVKPELFASIELDFAPLYQPANRSAKGAFFNYGVNASRSSSGGADTIYSGVAELGAFAPIGVITSSWALSQVSGNFDSIRLATTFVKDFPLDVQRLSAGDITAKPGAWGIGYRLGGIQFGTNYGTQPGSQISPVETISILADTPMLVRVLNRQSGPFTDEIDSTGVYYNRQQTLPFGPLVVNNLPTFGNGIYSVQGIAADGSVVQESQRYFFNQGLLKQGLHDYSVEIGKLRVGGFTDDYDTPIFTATERYGFSRRFTGEARIEYGDDVIAYGLSGSTAIPWVGALTTTIAQGQPTNGSFSSRGFQSASLTNRYRRLNYNLNFRHFDRQFIHPGESKDKVNTQRHSYAASVSSRLPWNDTVSLGYNAASSRAARFRDSLSLGYTFNTFALASATFLFRQELHQDDDWLAVASLSVNLESIARLVGTGSNRRRREGRLFTPQGSNLSIFASKDNDSDISSSLRLSTNASRDSESYGLSYRAPLLGDGPYGLSGNYSNRYFNINANVTEFNDTQTYSAGINGGMAYMGGGLYFTRPLTTAFGLVDLGEDAAGVRVNGIRTNQKGKVLIPNLQSYFDNTIRVNIEDLPLSAQLEEITTTVRPHFRSGVFVTQEIPYVTDMLVQVVLSDGSKQLPLPYAAEVALDDNSELFPVGDDGYIYLVGVVETSVIRVTYKNQSCTIKVPFPDELEPDEIPELGPFACEGVKP